MSESPDELIDLLEELGRYLSSAADNQVDTVTPPEVQLAAENAIATGIARLAGETPTAPTTEPSGRVVLARDMWITTDLVLRALRAAESS